MNNNIRKLLNQRKRSQLWLAETIGVSPGYMSELVSGKKTPSIKTLQLMASALEVPTHAILTFQEQAEAAERAYSFAEPDSTVFRVQESPTEKLLLDSPQTRAKQPMIFKVQTDLHAFAILKDDIIVADGANPSAITNGLVIATIANPDTGEANTYILRLAKGVLLHPELTRASYRMDTDNGAAAVLADVHSVHRMIGYAGD